MQMPNNFRARRPYTSKHIIDYFDVKFKNAIYSIAEEHGSECLRRDLFILNENGEGYTNQYLSFSVNFYGSYCASDIIEKFYKLYKFVEDNLIIFDAMKNDEDEYPLRNIYFGYSHVNPEDKTSLSFYVIFDIKEKYKHLFIEAK